ncbi:MAG: RtcB family protein [Candidatus Riflebacteria bacterium]|nr:RtcB family protein [Candidatus Riflebacteria bacterium]
MKNEGIKKAPVEQWLENSLSVQVRKVVDRWALTNGVKHIALMPDVHIAGLACVGCVIASENFVFPKAIGSDLGCGMSAIRFKEKASIIESKGAANLLMKKLYQTISPLRYSRQSAKSHFSNQLKGGLSSPELEKLLLEDGLLEFGTLGSGNHFLEFQSDEDNWLWLLIHSGSRFMGQAIASHHSKETLKSQTGLSFLIADSKPGQAFLQDLNWAVSYAAQSRQTIVSKVVSIMVEIFGVASDETSMIDCPHNFVRREKHFGEMLWIHRKGAISANIEELGIVPGSMGTSSFHVRGRGCEKALYSSAHGAGRLLSRTEAHRKITELQLRESMQGIWFDNRKIDAFLDEAPSAYKDISKVMRAQRELVKIERKLKPVLNYKGTL